MYVLVFGIESSLFSMQVSCPLSPTLWWVAQSNTKYYSILYIIVLELVHLYPGMFTSDGRIKQEMCRQIGASYSVMKALLRLVVVKKRV